jgi:hypothetical protein
MIRTAAFRFTALAALIVLTGCSSLTTRTTIQVPVPVECREKVADRPAMPTEAFTAKPSLDAWVKAQDAEIVLRESYEVQLRTALVICTTPIQP